MAARHLILGLAAGYHYGDVRPFLLSMERAGYEGDCVLFVSDTTRDLDRIRQHAVTISPIARTAELAHLPYNALRYFHYLNFIAHSDHQYDRILITDVRDVIFQRDPFDYPWPAGINCAMEEPHVTLGECPHNSHWIREHHGDAMFTSISDKRISCSGTTVADHAAMLNYLEMLIARLVPYAQADRMAGYDQGVHNVLVHTGQLPAMTLHANSGPIRTLGYTTDEPKTDKEGYVLRDNGERVHIVHQYDRKPKFFKTIRTRYA